MPDIGLAGSEWSTGISSISQAVKWKRRTAKFVAAKTVSATSRYSVFVKGTFADDTSIGSSCK
eukprot:3649428-Prymnesium_polylepis.1